MFKLELNKFKKVASDKHSTTMQHPDGHHIVIAHAALTPKLREHLASIPMAEAGERLQKQANPKLEQSKKEISSVKMADGGKVAKYADGDVVDLNDASLPASQTINPNDINQPLLDLKAQQQTAQQIQDMRDKGEAYGVPGAETIGTDPRNDNQKILDYVNQPEVAATPQQGVTPPSAPMAQAPSADRMPQSDNSAPAMQTPDIASGYNQQLQGIQQEAKAQGALGKEKAATIDKAIQQKQALQDEFNDHWNSLIQERQDFMDDARKNRIDPNKYWENHSKLATGIGIILAGFNPAGGPNAAIDFLNHQMDQNLKAQAENLQSAHNLIAANLHQFGNMKDAMNMARVMQSDMLTSHLESKAARATDPLAAARAKQLAGQLQMQAAPQFMHLAMNRSLMSFLSKSGGNAQQSGGSSSPDAANIDQYMRSLQAVNPAEHEKLAPYYVPGVGIASTPLPEKARDELISRQSLQEQVHNLRTWAQSHSGELKALSPADVNYGQALANSVQDAYRRANGQGVFREAEANFVKGIVADDPTAFLNKYRTDPKYKALEDSNMMALNGLKKGYGLPTAKPEQSLPAHQQNFLNWARQNPNDPKAQIVFKKLGIR